MADYWMETARGLAGRLQSREISAEELTKFYLDRIERLDKQADLNAVLCLNHLALEEARLLDQKGPDPKRPLWGLPILVKDNIDVRGLPTTAGSLALADNLAVRDADVIRQLRKSGALILGKTNLTEFANYTTQGMPNGFSSRGGQVKNPYRREADPGGSSSGSGVAQAASFAAASLGTDTSFSIIACAARNGIVGLKPPHGAVSMRGIIPISHTLDMAGPMTRSLDDALLIYACMRKKPLADIKPLPPSGLRLAVNLYRQDTAEPEQAERCEKLLEALREDGAKVGETEHASTAHLKEIMRQEFRTDLEAYLRTAAASRKTLAEITAFYEADPDERMRYGISLLEDALQAGKDPADAVKYKQALQARSHLRKRVKEELADFDACLMTGPSTIMHFTGLPSLTLPLGMGSSGLPLGLILYGADERRLWSAALTLEQYMEPVSLPPLP